MRLRRPPCSSAMPLSLVKQQLRRVRVVELSGEMLAMAKARAERSAVDADLAGFEVEYSERLEWGIVERVVGYKPMFLS
jgi:hypothetical protein